MSRIDATSEPSMEDILASIRRIIAEDPPGSRPSAPPPAQAAAATARRALPSITPAVESQLPTSPALGLPDFEPQLPRPSPAASAPQPAVRTEPSFASLSAYSSPFLPRAATPAPAETPSRIEHVLPSGPSPVSTQADVAPADRIDEQLSDLLGDGPAPTSFAVPAAPSFAAPSFGAPAPGLTMPSPVPAAGESETPVGLSRPGFTVSRVGYLLEQQPQDEPAKTDPFEFTLGPLPFERAAPKSEPELKSEVHDTKSQNFAQDIDALIAEVSSKAAAKAGEASGFAPVAHVEQATETPASMGRQAMESDSAADGAFASAPAAIAEIPAELPAVSHADGPDARAHAALDGTVAEIAQDSTRQTANDVKADAPAEDHDIAAAVKPAEKLRDILPLAPSSREIAASEMRGIENAVEMPSVDVPVAAAIPAVAIPATRSAAQADYMASAPASSFSVAHAFETSVAPAQMLTRSPEDALAELLRPMLRTWLAENMPKIVERALRQELAGQLGSDRKTAAE